MMDHDSAPNAWDRIPEREWRVGVPTSCRPNTLQWGAATARQRGTVITGPGVYRNAIGVHAGAFAPYRALAAVGGALDADHRPDLADTQPTVTIGPFAQWRDPDKIVTFDPWGHRVAADFASEIADGLDIRPSIAIASGRLHMPEIMQALDSRRLASDGEVLDQAGSLRVTKIAIEQVWWLPGVAQRLGLDEAAMREALVSFSGGMYPDLTSRPDLKVFLPPVGGMSVYLIGDPRRLGDPAVIIACRIHDECNGSDVFGSELCTCRSYLAFGVEDCVRTAQAGGLGVIVYNRSEGRALGEVVKYLVYNARQRAKGGDRSADYFARTQHVAGVEDLRQQGLTIDALHWLGIGRVDRWLSMSNLKLDALTSAGIEIVQQIELPEQLITRSAEVEISAKKSAGYFSAKPSCSHS